MIWSSIVVFEADDLVAARRLTREFQRLLEELTLVTVGEPAEQMPLVDVVSRLNTPEDGES